MELRALEVKRSFGQCLLLESDRAAVCSFVDTDILLLFFFQHRLHLASALPSFKHTIVISFLLACATFQ